MNRIDLHTHTTFSDGALTPEDLISYAYEKDLRAIAITDHDTVDGLRPGAVAAEAQGVELINGVEIATYYQDSIEIHILGLMIDPDNIELKEALNTLKDARSSRNIQMLDRFKNMGIDINIGLVKEERYDQLSRAHIALYLKKNGITQSVGEAYKKYLMPGCPTYVKRPLFNLRDSISVIKAAGGVAILAHPTLYGLEMNGIELLISELKEYGLMGIEAQYASHTDDDELRLKQVAKKYDLTISGGSDFHGALKEGIDLGTGRGRMYVPYKILEDMRHYKQTVDLN